MDKSNALEGAPCESCGMPLDTETTSTFDGRYCTYCQDQKSGALKSYDSVREGSIMAAMKFMGKTQDEAVAMVNDMLPKLPRWKK
jgi:hypothetical protein